MSRIPSRTFLLLLLDALLLAGSIYHTFYLLERPRAPVILEERGESIVVSRILDAAAASGLSPGDTVVAVVRTPIRSHFDAEFHSDFRSIGEELPITVVRGGIEQEFRPTLIPFFGLPYVAIVLLIAIVTLTVAVFVVVARPGDRTATALHLPLACMAFSVILMWGAAPPGELWPPISRSLYFVAYLGAGMSFHRFTTLFPRPISARAGRSILPYIPGFLLIIAAGAMHLSALLKYSVPEYHDFRLLFDLYHVALVLYFAIGIRNFTVAYRATTAPDQRKQLQWVLWGMTIGPAPFLLLEVIPELFIPLSPVPEELTLIFLLAIPASFAISLLRYHLFDIQLVIRRTTIYGVVIGGVVLVYLVLVTTATWLAGTESVITSAGAALIVALGFDTLRRKVQSFVDKRFFRVRYSFREAERRCVEEMKQQGDTRSLAELLVREVQGLMPSTGVSFQLTDEGGSRWIMVAEAPTGWLPSRNDIPTGLFTGGFPLLPVAQSRWVEPGVEHLPASEPECTRAGVVLVIPMAAQAARPIGLLIMGKKLSDVRYSREDVDLLVNLTTHAGLEIDRIRLQRVVFRQEVETARLQELNQMKSDFVDSVTHEFTTPLQGIILSVDDLREGIGKKRGRLRDNLDVIERQARRLARMVNTVLDSGRIERGEKVYKLVRADLGDLVMRGCREMQHQLEELGFTLRMSGMGNGKHFPLSADPDAVIEVVTNVIENAIKYSGRSRRIEVACVRRREGVACTVRDWGIGISRDALPRIFDKHFRDPAGGSVAEGFGIGLTVVAAVMQAHGGRVEVKSTPGRGSTFTLVFPRPGPVPQRKDRMT